MEAVRGLVWIFSGIAQCEDYLVDIMSPIGYTETVS